MISVFLHIISSACSTLPAIITGRPQQIPPSLSIISYWIPADERTLHIALLIFGVSAVIHPAKYRTFPSDGPLKLHSSISPDVSIDEQSGQIPYFLMDLCAIRSLSPSTPTGHIAVHFPHSRHLSLISSIRFSLRLRIWRFR